MDEKTQDMLKEAYHYGYAHATEDIENHLKNIRHNKKFKFKDEYAVAFDELLSGLENVLKNFANSAKNK